MTQEAKTGEVSTPQGDDISVYSGLMGGLGRAPTRHLSTWSVDHLLSTVSKRVLAGLDVSASTVRIVDSLLWPFLCRRSLRERPFTEKQLNSLVKSFRRAARNIHDNETQDNREQTYVKYFLDSYMCRAFGDPVMPVKADWIICPLFGGWAKKLIDRAIVKGDISFIYSLAKGSKLSWPALGEIREAEALRKHAARLSRESTVGDLAVDVSDSIGHTIFQTSSTIFSAARLQTFGTKFSPTGSACVQLKRREGGCLGLFAPLSVSHDDELRVGKLRALSHAINAWRDREFKEALYNANVKLFNYSLPPSVRNPVNVVAIAEPSKFRIITKSDGYLASALQPLQGKMLDCWKRHPASTMLLDDRALEARVDRMWRDLPSDFQFTSGDYEAATDLLERGATLCCFQALRGDPLYELGFESLMDAGAVYPDGTKVVIRQGQLMGHALSFPMLCVINLSVYYHTVRDVYGKRGIKPDTFLFDAMMRNVLVNGDDILFRAEYLFHLIFFLNARRVGLHQSVGKNYRSPKVAMINSRLYQLTGGTMRRVGYLNQRLLYGESAKKGDSVALPTSLGKDLSLMADITPWTVGAIPFALKRFNGKWSMGFQPNWYLPVHLGGYGVGIHHAPVDTVVTRTQRRIAAQFVYDPELALFRMNGNCLPLASYAGALAHWRVVVGDYVPREDEMEVSDEWLARIAYAVRMQHGGLPVVTDNVAVARSFRQRGGRLKPMSVHGLLRYWKLRLIAGSLPECPPLLPLRFAHVKLRKYWLQQQLRA